MATLTFSFTLKSGMSDGMQGGVADGAGIGQTWAITYSGAVPAAGSHLTIKLLDSQTLTTVLVGAEETVNIIPTFCTTYRDKVYVLAGSTVFFSEVGEPTKLRTIDGIGNGFVGLSNQVQTPEDMVAIVPFQGRLAFMSRQTTQIWDTPADPLQWQLQQTLQNIGTFAKLSVQQIGDLDAIFLSDTGVRSLRARESTLNAFVDDIGSPIDSIMQAVVASTNVYDLQARACSVVEPSSGRYWLFVAGAGQYVNGQIYVLSRFPSSKVAAWTIYSPTDSEGVAFYPLKFLVYQGRVVAWTGSKIYTYGGAAIDTYDSSVATVETGWLDLKTPGRIKKGIALNAAYTGTWKVEVGMDPVSANYEPVVWQDAGYTFDKGRVPFRCAGSHLKAKMTSVGAGAAIFSMLALHYNDAEDK